MTRSALIAAKRKGHTHAISRDRIRLNEPVEHNIVSTHRSYEDARRTLERGKGNAIYHLDELQK